MPIRMATLSRSKNGDFVSRKGIPKDVREAYTRLYRSSAKAPLRVTRAGGVPTAPKVWEELFKLPASTSPSAARVQWAEWCAEIDTRVATLRAAAKGEGQPLTQLNAQALAGKWYSWFLAQHENDTRLASHWADLRDYFVWDVIGPDALDRAIVKFWVNASFGNSSLIARWSPNLKKAFAKKYREDGWTIDSKKYPVRLVREKTLARHPLLGQWGTKGAPNMPWSWGHLMFSESRVIISTMLRLAREHNIPAAPVHDSLIVPRSKEVIAYRTLNEQFTKIIGVVPTLKLSPLNAAFF